METVEPTEEIMALGREVAALWAITSDVPELELGLALSNGSRVAPETLRELKECAERIANVRVRLGLLFEFRPNSAFRLIDSKMSHLKRRENKIREWLSTMGKGGLDDGEGGSNFPSPPASPAWIQTSESHSTLAK